MNKLKLVQSIAPVDFPRIRNTANIIINALHKQCLIPFSKIKELREKANKDETLIQAIKELTEILVNFAK